MLRDLDSRNGTMVGSQRIIGDHILHAGDIIRIGRSQLIFEHTLADAFSDQRRWPQRRERRPTAWYRG